MVEAPPSVSLVTMGCQRNEVDSDELAGRLAAAGWTVSDDTEASDVIVVNTCGFVEAAKKDSIDALLAAADITDGAAGRAVVAVGCLAERYGKELAEALPEARILSFDDYNAISDKLHDARAGVVHEAHTPRDRRTLLPLTPVERPAASAGVATPGHAGGAAADLESWAGPGSGPRPLRRRLTGGPVAPLKLASGCDRRCTFCAIPTFRGAFLSRPPVEVLEEAAWLASDGVKELVLVSENSTSYGKDLGDLRLLERLLPKLAAIDGIERVRVNYLQPAEMRPSLIDVLTNTEGVVPYFDLSFQHSSGTVLRRMKRFGDTAQFLDLVAAIRARAPLAGIRTNVIVGFPGETEAELAELEGFLIAARLDTVGVFGYSDEDGTEAATFENKVDPDEVAARVEHITRVCEELTEARAADRIGEVVDVLVEAVEPGEYAGEEQFGPARAEGRAAHQAPEVDGGVVLVGEGVGLGEIVRAVVLGNSGVDLIATTANLTDAQLDELALGAR
ncbi:MAG: MiaB/RimO family radical SAM methylthiotransferase [Sporichthyaceae bacterium]